MPDSAKGKLKSLLKLALIPTISVFAAAVIGLIYGLIAESFFTLQYVFPAAFAIGAIIVFLGVVAALLPVRPKMKDSRIIDHTNYIQVTMERRENKRKIAHLMIYLGMSIIMTAALIQWLLAFIFNLIW